jgi:hypothetical protein
MDIDDGAPLFMEQGAPHVDLFKLPVVVENKEGPAPLKTYNYFLQA